MWWLCRNKMVNFTPSWCRCLASLAANTTPVRKDTLKLLRFHFYYNFIQTVGILEGVSHCTKLLSVLYDTLDTSDVTRLTLKSSSRLTYLMSVNAVCRALTLDVLTLGILPVVTMLVVYNTRTILSPLLHPYRTCMVTFTRVCVKT